MRQKWRMSSVLFNVEKTLASKIPNASTPFEYFVSRSDFVMETKPLSVNKLKDALCSLKSNKIPGYGDISYNVIKKRFGSLCEPLKYVLNLSIEKGVFPHNLKIARVTPIYKGEDSSDVSNLLKF